MELRPGDGAGGADARDRLAAPHLLAAPHQQHRIVRIGRHPAIGVLDEDEIAVAAQLVAGISDGAGIGRQHGGAGGRGDVDAVVARAALAGAVVGEEPAPHRPQEAPGASRVRRRQGGELRARPWPRSGLDLGRRQRPCFSGLRLRLGRGRWRCDAFRHLDRRRQDQRLPDEHGIGGRQRVAARQGGGVDAIEARHGIEGLAGLDQVQPHLRHREPASGRQRIGRREPVRLDQRAHRHAIAPRYRIERLAGPDGDVVGMRRGQPRRAGRHGAGIRLLCGRRRQADGGRNGRRR